MEIRDGYILLNYLCKECKNIRMNGIFNKPLAMSRREYLSDIPYRAIMFCVGKCWKDTEHTLIDDPSKIP